MTDGSCNMMHHLLCWLAELKKQRVAEQWTLLCPVLLQIGAFTYCQAAVFFCRDLSHALAYRRSGVGLARCPVNQTQDMRWLLERVALMSGRYSNRVSKDFNSL